MTEGLQVAVVGLAVVFAFLTALVISVQLLGWCFHRYGHLMPDEETTTSRESADTASSRIAAAVAAIEAYRRRG